MRFTTRWAAQPGSIWPCSTGQGPRSAHSEQPQAAIRIQSMATASAPQTRALATCSAAAMPLLTTMLIASRRPSSTRWRWTARRASGRGTPPARAISSAWRWTTPTPARARSATAGPTSSRSGSRSEIMASGQRSRACSHSAGWWSSISTNLTPSPLAPLPLSATERGRGEFCPPTGRASGEMRRMQRALSDRRPSRRA